MSEGPDLTPEGIAARRAEQEAASARSKKMGAWALAIGAGLIGVIFIANSGNSGDSSPPESPYGDSAGAKDVCRQSVKDQLKSPATAKFSHEQATLSGDKWNVVGAVDSENGFGALIRTPYACTAIHESGVNWRTKSTLIE